MQENGLTQRVVAASNLGQLASDDELATRARNILRWKIRFNAVRVKVESGHVTLFG